MTFQPLNSMIQLPLHIVISEYLKFPKLIDVLYKVYF